VVLDGPRHFLSGSLYGSFLGVVLLVVRHGRVFDVLSVCCVLWEGDASAAFVVFPLSVSCLVSAPLVFSFFFFLFLRHVFRLCLDLRLCVGVCIRFTCLCVGVPPLCVFSGLVVLSGFWEGATRFSSILFFYSWCFRAPSQDFRVSCLPMLLPVCVYVCVWGCVGRVSVFVLCVCCARFWFLFPLAPFPPFFFLFFSLFFSFLL
jgi:hypothetical protein